MSELDAAEPSSAPSVLYSYRCKRLHGAGPWKSRLFREWLAAASTLLLVADVTRVGFLLPTWFVSMRENGHSPKGSGFATLDKWYPGFADLDDSEEGR